MSNPLAQVREFHETYGLPVQEIPEIVDRRVGLRLSLIDEERSELQDALRDSDIVEVADALGDLVYVVYGMALEFGIPLDKVIDEIHRSNMSKLGEDGEPIYRDDGKVLKGPHFTQPDIANVLGV